MIFHLQSRKILTVFSVINNNELKNEVAIKADYYRNPNMEYCVRCQILERDAPLIDLTLTVPTESEAMAIAANWTQKNEKIYANLMAELL